MAARAVWKGYLRLALVNCAVGLYPATTQATRIHFHKLNRQTGHRLKMRMVDEETGEVVPTDAQARGYQIAKGQSVIIEPEDLENIALESTHVLDIASFTSRRDIDPVYLDTSYFLVPEDKISADAFAVVREAMQRRNVAALAKAVMHDRERILLLEPRGPLMLATVLHWAYEMHDEKEILETVPAEPTITPDLLDVAGELIDRKMGTFDPSQFEDRYEKALLSLVKAKRAGKKLAPPKLPEPTGAPDVFQALKASLAQVSPPAARRTPAARTARGSHRAKTAPAKKRAS